MKVTKKDIRKIMEDKPDTFKGSQKDWSRLIKSIIIPPSNSYTWEQDKKTGEWEQIFN